MDQPVTTKQIDPSMVEIANRIIAESPDSEACRIEIGAYDEGEGAYDCNLEYEFALSLEDGVTPIPQNEHEITMDGLMLSRMGIKGDPTELVNSRWVQEYPGRPWYQQD